MGFTFSTANQDETSRQRPSLNQISSHQGNWNESQNHKNKYQLNRMEKHKGLVQKQSIIQNILL